MLEEASLLGQSNTFDQVTGIQDVSKQLKSRVRTFTGRLEDLREQIDGTAQCYCLLDKVRIDYKISYPGKNKTCIQCCFNVGPASPTLDQH